MARKQNTISEAVEYSGKGIFTGADTRVRLCPAEANTGILFSRIDLPDSPVVPGTADSLGGGYNCTVLRQNDVQIKTVEHLLSACLGLRVDNLIVELNGEELPGAGGCAQPYADLLLEAGIEEQKADKATLVIDEPVVASDGVASVLAVPPSEGAASDEGRLEISYVLEVESAAVAPQVVNFCIDPDVYMAELAPARTFAPESAYEEFEKRGLGGGVTDDNAVVIFEDGTFRSPLSRKKAELRFPDEFARHKVLDLMGDLALAGFDIEGKIVAVRSGHGLNGTFVKRLRALKAREKGPEKYLDINEVRKVLPHRYPFLMVDRILQIEEDSKIVGVKNVSINEPFFQGHYPDYPVMPGVLQLEALAQVAGVLLLQKLEHSGKLAFMVSMDGVKLRKPVQPGDQLILEAQVARVRSRSAQIEARATVNNEVTCEAEMKFMLVDREVL